MLASKKFLIPTAAAALALLLSACGSSSKTASSSSSASPSAASQPASAGGGAALVKTASDSGLGGKILVNARGLTLYRLSAEKGGKFICTTAACLQLWHPLMASGGKATGSVGSLGVVKRPDGTMQVTYKGQPLYTFTEDHAPGQTHGQGFKDVGTWNAVTTTTAKSAASTAAPSTSSSSSAPSSSSSSSGGGGYAY